MQVKYPKKKSENLHFDDDMTWDQFIAAFRKFLARKHFKTIYIVMIEQNSLKQIKIYKKTTSN